MWLRLNPQELAVAISCSLMQCDWQQKEELYVEGWAANQDSGTCPGVG